MGVLSGLGLGLARTTSGLEGFLERGADGPDGDVVEIQPVPVAGLERLEVELALPDWADSEWLKQLVAEQLVTVRDRRGYARQEWQKLRERNEALDARVYARAAAWILGADRFDERMWRQLEKQAGIDSAAIAAAPAVQTKPDAPEAGRVTAPRRRGWKISTPRYME